MSRRPSPALNVRGEMTPDPFFVSIDEGGRVEGRGAFVVVVVAGVEFVEVEFVIDQVAQGMFKTTGNDLLVKIHRQKFQTFVHRFVSSHPHALPMQCRASHSLMGEREVQVFLQPQRGG